MQKSLQRSYVLEEIARRIISVACSHPTRVGIDGVDGVGKTTFADELAGLIQALGGNVIRSSTDGFHRPRKERYARGRNSPVGYFHDSFDYPEIRTTLLDPLGPRGSLRYRVATFGHRIDRRVDCPVETAPRDAILLFDGMFLHRPQLSGCFEFTVFLDAPAAGDITPVPGPRARTQPV